MKSMRRRGPWQRISMSGGHVLEARCEFQELGTSASGKREVSVEKRPSRADKLGRPSLELSIYVFAILLV